MEHSDLDKIKSLVPFRDMSEKQRKDVLARAQIVTYPEGKMIFKRSESDNLVYWLVSGSVDLLDGKFEVKNRKASEDLAKFMIDNNDPHLLSAVTTEETRILQVGRDDLGLSGSSEGNAQVNDVDNEEVDWMSTLLSSPLFEFIPPTNIQTLFSKFEAVNFDAGQAVIRQGDPGDYFYVIQSGKARVERSAGDKTAVLAELKAGDNFGQDALVSDVPRNATVVMVTRGTLMRLSEPDFQSLLMQPLIETVTMDEVNEMIEQGDPKTYIIDVRNPKEVEEGKIPGSINLPLLSLRKNLPKLKPEAVYVTVSRTGRRGELAAYILNENGFTAYVLKDKPEAES